LLAVLLTARERSERGRERKKRGRRFSIGLGTTVLDADIVNHDQDLVCVSTERRSE